MRPTIKETKEAIEELCPINRAHVKKLALKYAKTLRPAARFERVSEQFITAVMYDCLTTIKDRVLRHPAKGVTLK
jgi:hypothetical protein